MKGEQPQNFVEHRFSRPGQEITQDGFPYWPNIPSLNRLVRISPGSAMDSESEVYSQWGLRAWLRQGRIDGSLFCETGSGEDESEDTSQTSLREAGRERKQKKLWAYRQRTMGWVNPLTWTRPAFRRRLNPSFVDVLMNWPSGWTSARTVFGPEEMELWLSRERRQLSVYFGGLD